MPGASPPRAARQLGMFNVKDYGATGSGYSTDDSTAVQAAITACAAAGGGTVYFPPGTYYCASQLTIPDDSTGTWPKVTANIRLQGAAAFMAGQSVSSPPPGSSVLDLRSSTSPGKLYSRGVGQVEIDHLTFRNESSSTTPFVYVTGTSVNIHDCAFMGYSSKAGTSCDQDAIVLGGSTITEDGTSSAPFQGYIARVTGNFFQSIRRAVWVRVYANANYIAGNWIGHTCGSDQGSTGCCFEITGAASNSSVGNVFVGNQIEMIGYTYGFRGEYAQQNVFVGNGFYDAGTGTTGHATSVACYRFEANGQYNEIVGGYYASALSILSEHATSAGKNGHVTGAQGVGVRTDRLQFGSDTTCAFASNGTGRIYAYGRVEMASLGVGNTASGSTLGTVTAKLPVYDRSGNIVGYAPLYNSIT